MKIPILVVCGPTASGKTSLAIELAKRFNGEVVSADSMQIYRGMDIGTAKPSKDEMEGVAHHMISVADIDSNFSVSNYCDMAHGIIKDIFGRGKMPILAGGTGLYINSLVNDIDFNEGGYNPEIRRQLTEIANTSGVAELHNMLEKLDSQAAESIHMNNVKRVIRALEHIETTGEKFSEYKKRAAATDSRYNPLMLFIDWDREELYRRIDLRVDLMMQAGLLYEARSIYDNGYPRTLTSMCAIGYKELFDYLDGKCTLQEAVDTIKQNSRRYAKRQLTWFRSNENLNRISADGNILKKATEAVQKWLEVNANGEIHL